MKPQCKKRPKKSEILGFEDIKRFKPKYNKIDRKSWLRDAKVELEEDWEIESFAF